MIAVVPAFLHSAVEADVHGVLAVGDHPHLAAGQPEFRQLGLPAVDDLLVEDAEFIAQGIAHAAVAVVCQTVEEAGGESAETAVAETRVRLLVIYFFKGGVVVRQTLRDHLFQIEIVEIVAEGASHEEFHAEIVNSLAVVFFAFGDKILACLKENITHDEHDCLVDMLVVCVLRLQPVVVGELGVDKGLHLLCVQVVHK